MVISDLIASKAIDPLEINHQNWCDCIDGALTRQNYIENINRACFSHIEILDEKSYTELDLQNDAQEMRKISSISIRAFIP